VLDKKVRGLDLKCDTAAREAGFDSNFLGGRGLITCRLRGSIRSGSRHLWSSQARR
jgi:hypothetical protein